MTALTEAQNLVESMYMIHCGGCRTDTSTLGWLPEYVSTVLRAHAACCDHPLVARGALQRQWLQHLLAGDVVRVPTRIREYGGPRKPANHKPSFYNLIRRLGERGFTLELLDDWQSESGVSGYRVVYSDAQRKGLLP